MYAQAKFGSDYVVIGTYFGTGKGCPNQFQPAPPDLDGIDGVLSHPGSAIWFYAADR
jgi:hypothetical protein